MSRKSEYIGLEVEPDLKERARQAAARDGRTLSGWVRHVLRRTLEVRRRVFEDAEEPRVEAT